MKAVRIPVTGPVEVIEFPESAEGDAPVLLAELYSAIGCDSVECVRLTDVLDAWLNETGAVDRQALNHLATHLASTCGIDEPLHGVVVVLAVDHHTGHSVGLTHEHIGVITRLARTSPPRIPGTVRHGVANLPDWLPAWCLDHLGGEPAGVLFQLQQISMVFGLRLAGGKDVVVKARADEGRAVSCVAAQARLAERGFPCARPLTPVVGVGSLAVHAEEFRPGGEVLHGDSPDIAMRNAEVFARLMAELADVTVAPPLPNPPWVRWDHADPGAWPAIAFLDSRDQSVVPAYVVETAERARGRLLAAGLPCVLGHADFEAQNLRWQGRTVWAVHDWDSLAWQPEAALVGAASGSFASAGPPTLAPIESSEAFLVAYQDIRGRSFTAVELEIAWAASLWMAAYNAREEALLGVTSVCGDALRAQAAERLRRCTPI